MKRLTRPAALALCLAATAFLAAGEPVYHVLEKGETVYAIARKYKVPFEAVMAANKIADASKLKAGQRLLIPLVHVIAKGETLYGIARDYGVGLEQLRSANGLTASSLIKPGQLLYVPASAAAAAAKTAATTTGTGTATGAGTAAGGGTVKPPSGTAGAGGSSGAGSGAGSASASGGSAGGASASPASTAGTRLPSPSVSWPVKGQARYLEGKLFGVAIATELGAASRALASGSVVSAGPYRGYGLVAFVQSRSGYIYVYGGLDSLSVSAGEALVAGRELGKVGRDREEGTALAYFFVFKEGRAIDPAVAPRE